MSDLHYYFAERQPQEKVTLPLELKEEMEREMAPRIHCSREGECSLNGPQCFIKRACGLEFPMAKYEPPQILFSTNSAGTVLTLEEIEEHLKSQL